MRSQLYLHNVTTVSCVLSCLIFYSLLLSFVGVVASLILVVATVIPFVSSLLLMVVLAVVCMHFLCFTVLLTALIKSKLWGMMALLFFSIVGGVLADTTGRSGFVSCVQSVESAGEGCAGWD